MQTSSSPAGREVDVFGGSGPYQVFQNYGGGWFTNELQLTATDTALKTIYGNPILFNAGTGPYESPGITQLSAAPYSIQTALYLQDPQTRRFDFTGSGTGAVLLDAPIFESAGGSRVVVAGPTVRLGNGVNGYQGGTAVEGGTLLVGANAGGGTQVGALGTGLSVEVGAPSGAAASAALLIDGGFQVGKNVNVLAGNAGTARLGENQAATGVFTGNVSLGKSAELYAAAGGAAVFAGSISGAGGIAKEGAGQVLLQGSNSYSGGTSVDEGILRAHSSGALGAGGVNVGSGGALILENTSHVDVNGLSGGGSLTLNGADVVETGAGDTTFSGTIAGTHGITKTGSGSLTLSGDNTYAGGTGINGGVVRAHSSNALGTGTVAIGAGGTLSIENEVTTNVNGLSGSGDLVLDDGFLFEHGSGATEFSGTVSGSGGMSKAGTGSLTLSGNNTYTRGTSVDSGTLRVRSDSGLGAGIVNVNAAGTLSLENGANVSINGLSGTGALALAGGDLREVGNGSSTFSGDISGTGGVTKAGGGTLVLSGANDYAGTTTVESGTLKVNGAHVGGGDYSVAAGARLGGTGSIGADVDVLAGGVFAPGNSPGTLAIDGDLAFADGAVYEWEVGALDYDRAIVSGALSFGAGMTLRLLAWDPGVLFNGPYELFSFGSLASDLPSWTIDYGTTGWEDLTVTYDAEGKRLLLAALSPPTSDVPEPGALALVVLSAGAFAMGRTKRTRRESTSREF